MRIPVPLNRGLAICPSFETLAQTAHRLRFGRLPTRDETGPETGLIVVADGVGGFDLCVLGLRYALAWSGLSHRLETLDWSHGTWRWYRDLTRTERHEAQAASLAERVRDYRDRHPDRPVFLVGKSGGSGIVVRALERLPEKSLVRGVLLSPALSPGYDLTAALGAIERELVVFWSPLDVVLLGLGTWVFGTIDRVHTVSAGLVGFQIPAEADESAYRRKLRQVRWHPRMAAQGYLGGHVGTDHPTFLKTHVVPLFDLEDQSGAMHTPGSQAGGVPRR